MSQENKMNDKQLALAAPYLLDALKELVSLMEDVRQGNYVPDQFTCQTAELAIRMVEDEKWKPL